MGINGVSVLQIVLAFLCEPRNNWRMRTQDVLQYFGGREELAKALGIDRSASYQWGDTVPQLRQYQIQIVTKGKLKADKPMKKAA